MLNHRRAVPRPRLPAKVARRPIGRPVDRVAGNIRRSRPSSPPSTRMATESSPRTKSSAHRNPCARSTKTTTANSRWTNSCRRRRTACPLARRLVRRVKVQAPAALSRRRMPAAKALRANVSLRDARSVMREIEMASVLRRAGRATANSAHAPLLRAMATHGANLIVLPIARPASTPDNAPNFAATASCLREMAEHGNRHAPLGMVSAAPTRSARATGSVL